jgi:conjugal transfer pilus assembly protein TraF
MIRCCTMLLLSFFLPHPAMADVFADKKPHGFLWYDLVREAEPSSGVPFSQLSYTTRDKVLHFYTIEALHKARQTKSLDDVRTFLMLQDYWMKESSHFSQLFQKALLYYPEFDYSITHPSSSIGTKWLEEDRENRRHQAIQHLSKTYGLLFFYRGSNAFDQKQIPIIRDFCERFRLALIPVSVDGVLSPELATSRLDNGQANRLGVRYFPAILLVNPRKQETQPVAYGLTTQDVLEKRVFQAATHYQGGSV